MLANILKKSLIICILSFFLVFTIEGSYDIITFFNLIYVLISFSIIFNCYSNNFYSKNQLIFILAICSILFIATLNIISFNYNNDFFVFNASDAVLYHDLGILMNKEYNISKIMFLLENQIGYADMGMPLLLSFLYEIVESNLILNLLYFIIGIYTALLIYNISSFYMSKRYSFLCSLSYSLSSYTLYYLASGLKEPILIFLVLLSIYIYLKRIYFKNKIFLNSLILLSIPLVLILFFRPVISIFLIISFMASYFFKLKSKGYKLFFIVVILFFVSLSFPVLIQERNTFLTGGSLASMIDNRVEHSSLIKGGLGFTYFTNVVSSLFGPFPNFDSANERLSIYASGLVFKSFLSIFFLLSAITIIRNRRLKFYPLLIFIFLEIISLVLILEALELRKSLPHIPIFFILSFWCLYKLDIEGLKKKTYITNSYFILIFIAMIIWNFRF